MRYYMTTRKHGLGWVPDKPDQRDYIFRPRVLGPVKLPDKVDLRKQCPKVYDQGQLGSCTANALGAAFDFDRKKQGKDFMTPSRLFIYWNERDMEGTVDVDAGASIRDGVKVLVKLGTCDEESWPYDIDQFTKKPNTPAYKEAQKNQALTYQRIMRPLQDATQDMLICLSRGYPFVAGISVYESFEGVGPAKSGIIPMPRTSERLLGGHAILVIGYDTRKQWFICRNSWGQGWGDKGYFYMPFAYLTNRTLSSDFWLISSVEV